MDENFAGINIGESGYSLMEKFLVRRFHPRKIILDLIGFVWAVYFLWLKQWQSSLLCVLTFSLLGLYFTRNVNLEEMGDTTLGKLGLLHTHPMNFALNILGLFPLAVGIWRHFPEYIIIGFSIVLLGHFFGWSKFNRNYK